MITVGHSLPRKEAFDKVTGAARYNADVRSPGLMQACLVTSPYAHARIAAIDTSAALKVPGVRAVLTGDDVGGLLCGEVLEDRPPLARKKVRHYGEPVALVVAHDEWSALQGVHQVHVRYEPLPVVNDVTQALDEDAPLIHEQLGHYKVAQQPCFPEEGSNVADTAHIRKGQAKTVLDQCEVVVASDFRMPQLDHAPMETHCARVELLPDGAVSIHSTTQAPYEVQKMLAQYFKLDQGQVVVHAPLLGGAFGGKAPVQLEILAYLASKAVGGCAVRIVQTREHDLTTSPVAQGMQGRIRVGADRDGRLRAMEMRYLMDIGAYTDSAPRIARAIASECTGPYNVPNVHCDVLCVYTNHCYTTAYRGFGHMHLTFPVERIMDKLARKLQRDPLDLRLQNAIQAGHSMPTQVKLTPNTLGDVRACLSRAGELIHWGQASSSPGADAKSRASDDDPALRERADGAAAEASGQRARYRRATGMAAIWKTSSSPPNAISGAIVTMNADGSVHLSTGAVEFGPGTKTTAAQILAENLGIDPSRVHVHMDVNTQVDPEHWKTVASMSTFMVGRAVMAAANDLKTQLRAMAAIVLRCPPDDLEVAGGRCFLRDDPAMYVDWKDIAHGYMYKEGDSIGGQIIGRGSFIMRHLTPLDGKTGHGMPGPTWTVGAQAVEVELDRRDCTYRILKAVTVLDAGRVINPKTARGVVMGGMSMGLGYGSRECHKYGEDGQVLTEQLRTYKVMRMGEQPVYGVDFIETPQVDGPYGARPLGEHAVIGMPAALANALSRAAGVPFDEIPITPERIWRALQSGGADRRAGRAAPEREPALVGR